MGTQPHEIHVGANGVRFLLEFVKKDTDRSSSTYGQLIPLDITGATISARFSDPDGATTDKTAVVVSPGTDGLAEYYSEGGLLASAGDWKLQGTASEIPGAPSGSSIPSRVVEFEVFGNLPAPS